MINKLIFYKQYKGVHPVYYWGFLHWALLNECTKYLYKAEHKFTFIPNWIRVGLKWYVGILFLNYFALAIVLLDFHKAMEFSASVYYLPSWLPLLCYFFFLFTKYG